MSFTPRQLANGRTCCSNVHALCPACRTHFGLPALPPPPNYAKSHPPDPWANTALRAAAGARHSADDQAHLDAAAAHLAHAGAAPPTPDIDIPAEDPKKNLPWQSHRSASGGNFLLRSSEAHPPRGQRLLRSRDELLANVGRDSEPPNAWAAPATLRAAELADAIAPSLDPAYKPYGAAPDGWAIGLAVAQEAK